MLVLEKKRGVEALNPGFEGLMRSVGGERGGEAVIRGENHTPSLEENIQSVRRNTVGVLQGQKKKPRRGV